MGELNRHEPEHAAIAGRIHAHLAGEHPFGTDSESHAETLAAVAKAAARMHERLVTASLYVDLLQRRLSNDATSQDVLNNISAKLLQLGTSLDDLMHFASPQQPQSGQVSLADLIQDVLAPLSAQCSAQKVRTEVSAPKQLAIHGEYAQLHSALRHLVCQSLGSMPTGGEIVITAVESAAGVEIEVADSGPGLPRDQLGVAFEPFRLTREQASGLELSIVAKIMAAHGGRASARNCPEGGMAWTLQWPAAVARQAAA